MKTIKIVGIIIVLSISIYFVIYQKTETKKEDSIKAFNRNFEDSYQKITSMQYDYGSGGLFGQECDSEKESELIDKINQFNENSNLNDVSNTVNSFISCIREKRIHIFDKENNLISDFASKIEKLQTSEQKKLAEQLLIKSRDVVKAKQEYNSIWDDFYDKQIKWAEAIENYIMGRISLFERNNVVAELNAYDLRNPRIREARNKIDNIEAERTDFYNRLMSILPR